MGRTHERERESCVCLVISPPCCSREMSSLKCLKEAEFHIFFIKSSVCYLSRYNNLKLKPPQAALEDDEHVIYNCLFLLLPLSFFLLPSQPSSVLQFHLWKQVLGLWLAFCIVDSDGTGDALRSEPDIAVSRQMTPACEPCPGIKTETIWQSEGWAKLLGLYLTPNS